MQEGCKTEIDYRVSGSLAPTRDQWEGPATKNIYSGTNSFGIDIFRCGRAFSQRPYSLFQFFDYFRNLMSNIRGACLPSGARSVTRIFSLPW